MARELMSGKKAKSPANYVGNKPGPKTDVLSPRQELFCLNYIIFNEMTKAALAAGYASSSAHVAGSRLMKTELIQNRIAELTTNKLKAINIKADNIIEEIAEVAFTDLNRCGPYASVNVQAKLRALEMLGKWRKIWQDINVFQNINCIVIEENEDDGNDITDESRVEG